MVIRTLGCAMALVLAFPPMESRADLVHSSWQSLLTESTVVIRAHAQKLTLGAGRSGAAELRVKQVLRGRYPAGTIEVRWSSEVHDQAIDRLGSEYLLFLKMEHGHLVAAQYGRSYWPVEYGPNNEQCVVYRSPVTEVVMPEDLLKRQVRFGFESWPSPPCEAAVDIILVDRVISVLGKPQ